MSGRVPEQVPEEPSNAMPSMMTARTHTVQIAAMQAQIARHNAERSRRYQPVHAPGTGVIMAPPLTVKEPPTKRLIGQSLLIPVDGRPAKVDPAPTTRPVPVVPWLDAIAFFIPKSIREPFLGDLHEDLADMAAKGHSRASVWWAAISQVAILALRWTWSNVLRR